MCVRPTLSRSYSQTPSGYEVPLSVSFPSGFVKAVVAMANPEFPGYTCAIPLSLLKEAGGAKKNRLMRSRIGDTILLAMSIPWEGHDLVSSAVAQIIKPSEGMEMLIGDALLHSFGDVELRKGEMRIQFPKTRMFLKSSLDALSHSAVLILGADSGTALLTLRAIEVFVNDHRPLRGWLLRDYHDIAGRDLHQKLALMAAASRFIVVADTPLSGHLVELPIILTLSTPIAILRKSGAPSTWMIDPLLGSSRVRVFEYTEYDHLSLYQATAAACAWASAFIMAKANDLDARYPWRAGEIALADLVFPEKGYDPE